ncbi:hypothetical protein GDO78_017375 [Eleutherodactylus coqui]|uniref:GIY-YIG domain-containing protein n=1 Tax=Eleutherodactylus coqui TaxID=57060 RepID=A0A8J6EJP8_ELECQ|nr:hypothetical protein GDO78_017375 [Eleutherodactylus coqui]
MCSKCPVGGLYVGETGQKLKARMRSHRHTIEHRRRELPVAEHFSNHGHDIGDMRVLILKGGFKSQNHRRIWEYKLITTFDTLNTGLNYSPGFMREWEV